MNRLTMDQKIRFNRAMRDFWSRHGQRALDHAIIIMVPTLLFAPAYVRWFS